MGWLMGYTFGLHIITKFLNNILFYLEFLDSFDKNKSSAEVRRCFFFVFFFLYISISLYSTIRIVYFMKLPTPPSLSLILTRTPFY